uniref:Transmembrane protein 157 n=1 Tax=Myotis myotis TaxID=51298 RepID=A0A7J7XZ00_MYOMY|nr:family with sequence similarity 174 member A [Myotis myotis]
MRALHRSCCLGRLLASALLLLLLLPGLRGPLAVLLQAALAADDPAGKAGEQGSVGGVLAVSPNPGEKPMTQRALTVLMVVSGAVLVYFVVRTVRMRRRNRKTRRYGVLDTNIENMELTPLEQDDEDDDNTLFDANHPRR